MSVAQIEETTPQAKIENDCDLSKSELVSPAGEDGPTKRPGSNWWIASGVFLFVLALYALTSPGRIDIVDGQARFDVAYNWLVTGRPIIRDHSIKHYMGVPGRHEFTYSYYGAPGSVFAMPLVWLGLVTSAPAIQPSQFLFSLTSSIFGAGIALILFLFYLELGVMKRRAFAWTMVSSFATFIWPASNTTFDNAQHAFFALAAVYLGFLGARRKSAVYAAGGGLMAGVLVLYQEYFLLIIPALALSTLEWRPASSSSVPASIAKPGSLLPVVSARKQTFRAAWTLIRAAWEGPGESRSSCLRYGLFLAAVSVGVLLSLAYNDLRFGSYLENGKVRSITANAYPLFGNPLAGFLTLLVSPGKSIFLYSPPIVLCIMGMRSLWRRQREIAVAILLASLLLVLFLSCICFVGGDWCWGPRYLAVLVPLWALTFPFISFNRVRRELAVAIIGVGVLVQVMALSVDTQRFFLEKEFHDYFWAEDHWVYFKCSALFTRLGETVSLSEGPPPNAHLFNSYPVAEWGADMFAVPRRGPRWLARTWIRDDKMFFIPRPWPLWMPYLPPRARSVNPDAWLVGLLSLAMLGTAFICRGFQKRECQ
jgi:hypothetical protein